MNLENRNAGSNELILNPGEYAFMQDKTSGNVQTHVGPLVVTQSGQHRPIKFEHGQFDEASLEDAVEQSVSAQKGEYLILHNPTIDAFGLQHPTIKNTNAAVPTLRHGEKIVIQGPVQFALWPEQTADVVKGHNLRNDQFLVVRVYDAEAAISNWEQATIVASEDAKPVLTNVDLTLGQLLVIKDVSFYIPATGIEVVEDVNGSLVRDALTLEMSEYAILIDQSGNKRYEKGPQIVFPEPTEEFFMNEGTIKFRPIELTNTQGLHLKINCEYTDYGWPNGSRTFTEGEEIFITGETHPIYYPREEHSIIRYGDNLIHYATAVPAGQARYVMNKDDGVIKTIEGPNMVLLDPTNSVFVQRVLSDNESLTMYPGNIDSLEYNRSLRQFQVSDSETSSVMSANFIEVKTDNKLRGISKRRSVGIAALPDQIQRQTTYTKPHSVTFDDNRFNGVPVLRIWTGYAVLLVKANGERRVEVGPKTVILGYDETLQTLHLSTNKPKTTDKLLTTGYLEINHNKVGDIIRVETLDGVEIDLKVSYRVSFVGESTEWFNVDNYVKFLCDNCRSRLKGITKQHKIRDFYNNSISIVRDTLLGVKTEDMPRSGRLFEENGMTLTEVDLLGVTIVDNYIGEQLISQQQAVITDQIKIDRSRQTFEVEAANQKVEKDQLGLKEELRQLRHSLELKEFDDSVAFRDLKAIDCLKRSDEKIEMAKKSQESSDIDFKASHARQVETQTLNIEEYKVITNETIKRFKAAEGDLSRAINQLGDQKVLETVAQAVGPMSLIGDINLSTVIGSLIGSDGQKSKLFDRLTNLVNTDSGS